MTFVFTMVPQVTVENRQPSTVDRDAGKLTEDGRY